MARPQAEYKPKILSSERGNNMAGTRSAYCPALMLCALIAILVGEDTASGQERRGD